jgi:hypothetical protein
LLNDENIASFFKTNHASVKALEEEVRSLRSCVKTFVLDRQPTRGVPKVDECGLSEIGNSKEETRGTQFR